MKKIAHELKLQNGNTNNMKTSIQDIINLKKVAIATKSPQNNSAVVNKREIIVTYSPSKLYPYSVKLIEGEHYEIILFADSEMNKVRDVWNKFLLGNYSKEALKHETAAEQQYQNSKKIINR